LLRILLVPLSHSTRCWLQPQMCSLMPASTEFFLRPGEERGKATPSWRPPLLPEIRF
jgi:hypothetical protein